MGRMQPHSYRDLTVCRFGTLTNGRWCRCGGYCWSGVARRHPSSCRRGGGSGNTFWPRCRCIAYDSDIPPAVLPCLIVGDADIPSSNTRLYKRSVLCDTASQSDTRRRSVYTVVVVGLSGYFVALGLTAIDGHGIGTYMRRRALDGHADPA